MERPKVVVNVKFEDKDCSSDRLVNEKFEFELVGSHIHVRPLPGPGVKSEAICPPRKCNLEGGTPEVASEFEDWILVEPGQKRDANRKERFNDGKRNASRDRGRDKSPCWSCPQVHEDESRRKILYREASRRRLLSPRSREDSPKHEPGCKHRRSPARYKSPPHIHRRGAERSRHVSRREEYERGRKKLEPVYLTEVSSWSIGGNSEERGATSKGVRRCRPECGKIHYCLHEAVKSDSEGSDSSGSSGSSEVIVEKVLTKRKIKQPLVSEHCDFDCYINEEPSGLDRDKRRREEERRRQEGLSGKDRRYYRKIVFDPRDPYGSYEEMLEESVLQFQAPPRDLQEKVDELKTVDTPKAGKSTDKIDEKANLAEGKHRARPKEHHVKLHRARHKDHGRRHAVPAKSKSESSSTSSNESTDDDKEKKQDEKRPADRRRKHHHKSHRHEEKKEKEVKVEETPSSTKTRTFSEEELINILAARLYERRLQMKVVLAFKRLLEQKRARESLMENEYDNEEIRYYKYKHRKPPMDNKGYRVRYQDEDRGHTYREPAGDIRTIRYRLKEPRLPNSSTISCAVRCCSKRHRMEDFYKAHLKIQEESQKREEIEKKPQKETVVSPEETKNKAKKETEQPPKETKNKAKKEKSAPSLYDMGLRTNEKSQLQK